MKTYKAPTKTQAIWDTKLAEIMKICRGCLATERRMIKVTLFEDFFKDLIGIVIFPTDGLPKWLCYECCALLHKYNRFKKKLIQSHLMLSKYVLKKQPFTFAKDASPHLTQSSVQYCEFPSIPTEQQDEEEEINGALIGETDTPVATKINSVRVKEEIVFSDYEDNIAEEECREETPQIEDAHKLLEDILKKTCTVKLHRLQLTEARKVSRRKSRVESEARRQSLRAQIQFDDDIGIHAPEKPVPDTKGRDPKDTTSGAKNNEPVVSINKETKSICNIVIKNEPLSNDDILDQINDSTMLPESDVNKEIVIVNVKSERNVNNNSLDNINSYTCNKCNRHFDSKILLTAHHLQHLSYKCDVCMEEFRCRSDFNVHVRLHTIGKPSSTDTCMKSKSRNENVKKHIIAHTGEKPFKCEICMSCFSKYSYLRSHILRVHTGYKPYKCKICSKSFKGYYRSKSHICHNTGDKPYKCEICMKSFITGRRLDLHKRIHTGDKPYKCEICMKRYSSKYRLKGHVRVHTGDKPYKCNECMKSFRLESFLKAHTTLTHKKDISHTNATYV